MNEQYKKVLKTLGKLASAGATDEEIGLYLRSQGLTIGDIGTLVEGPTVAGQAKEFLKGLPTGAIGLLETAATGAAAVLPEGAEQAVRETVGEVATAARRPFQAAPGYEETIPRKFGEATGSILPFLPLGAAGALGRVGALGLGAGAGAGEARIRAEEEGGMEQRGAATGLGAVVGLTEALPVFAFLDRLSTPIKEGIFSYVRRAAVAGGQEGAQEAAASVAQDLIAKGLYKPEQVIGEQALEEGAYGAGVGALVQGILDMSLGRRAKAPAPAEPPAETPVGLPAEAKQAPLFGAEELPTALVPDESAYAQRQELMMDEGRRQQALMDVDSLRNEFDTLQRENERLKTAFDAATTDEEKAAIKEQAGRIAPALDALQKEIKKIESKLPAEERGRAQAAPEQMGLDFEMPLMERQRTPEGVVLGEQPAPPTELTQEQRTFFDEGRIQGIRDRMVAGEMVTPAEMEQVRLAGVAKAQELEAAPTPDLGVPREIPEARPPFALQRTDIEQPSAAPREPITVTPEGEAIIGRPEVEERRVVEDDFKAMGIGATNKKLRAQLLGKDLADPAQRAEVKEALEDYANDPNRSEKLRTGVENFLSRPMFMEQLPLDLRERAKDGRKRTRKKPGKPVDEAGAPGVPPSVPPGGEGGALGVEAPVPAGVDESGLRPGDVDVGEGAQQRPMRREFIESARRTYNRLRDEGSPSWKELSFGQQLEFMDAFEQVKGVPRYRRAPEGTQGMSVDNVRKLVNRITAKWKKPPDIFVVQSVSDLADYGLENVGPRAKGVFEPGTQSVFLIADNITDYSDAVITVAHESIGHFGLQSVLGDTYKQTMNRLYQNPDVKKAADIKLASDPTLTLEIAVEEVIAEAVEKKVAPQSGLGRALATLRNILRNFFNRLTAKVPNSEIDALIAQSANYVIAGTVQVDKKVTNTDAFKDWFGDSVIRNPDGTPKIMYHGTARDIGTFRPKQAGAIFITEDPDFAESFSDTSETFVVNELYASLSDKEKNSIDDQARKIAKKEGTSFDDELLGLLKDRLPTRANVMPLYVRAEAPFDYKNDEDVQGVIDYIEQYKTPEELYEAFNRDIDVLDNLRSEIEAGSWLTIENPVVQEAIKFNRHDGFYVREGGRKNLAVYDPNQVKSATGNAGSFRRDTGDIRLSKKADEFKPVNTSTESFKDWFKGSVVRNPDGSPMVVYHGTQADITAFTTDVEMANRGGNPDGFYFTPNQTEASRYAEQPWKNEFQAGANVMPVYLSLTNPFNYSNNENFRKTPVTQKMVEKFEEELRRENPDLREDWIQSKMQLFKERSARGGDPFPNISFSSAAKTRVLEAGGYDGMIDGEHFVVFEPSQIKSSISNVGTFATTKSDIRYRKAPTQLTAQGEEAAKIFEQIKGISNPKPKSADETLIKRLKGMIPSKDAISWETRIRRQLVDKEAPIAEQLKTKFNNAVKDELTNTVNPKLLLAQKQDIANFGDKVVEIGGIRIGKDGLIEMFERKDAQGRPINMDRVLEIVNIDLAKKLGSADLAVDLAHNALIGFRAGEINKFNERMEKQAAAAEAKGNKLAAKKLRDQIINTRVSQEQIDAATEAMQKFPEIRQAYDVFTEFKNGLVDFLETSGRINSETAKNWRENVGYVPWTRVEEKTNEFELDMAPSRGAYINLSKEPHLDKEGSSKEINNIFDNMVGTAFFLTKMGIENHANLSTLKVLPDVKELTTPDEIRAAQKKHADRLMFSYDNGERKAYLLSDPFQLSAFMTIPAVKNGLVMGTFANAAKLIRTTITHMPAFAISQLIQDGTYRGMLLSGVRNPWAIPPKVFGNFFKLVFKDGSVASNELARMGVTGTYDGMPDNAIFKVKERLGLEHRNAFKRAWDGLEKFSLAADLAVRSAIYDQTLKETGDRALAFYRAKEYINFKRQGVSPVINTLRQSIPFMNAYMQGMDILYRTMTGKGVAAAERKEAMKLFYYTGAQLAVLNLLYAMAVAGDDEYEGLDEFVKNKNYIIPGTGIRIPVAPEVGFFFKVLPEQLYRYINDEGTQNPQDAKALRERITNALGDAMGGVGYLPAAIKPALEVATNYSFFLESPIVGAGLRNRDPRFQFTESTSELAKILGDIANISPAKIDYFMRAYTGMAGAMVLDLSDAALNPDRMEKPIYKIPQISSFMYDPTGRGLKSNFYKFREDVTEVRDTINMLSREGRIEELEEYLTPEKIQVYALRGVISKLEKQLSDLRKYRKIVAADQEMSPEERRALTNEILQMERDIVQAYDIPQLRKMAGY